MHTGTGQILEVSLADGQPVLRLSCPPNLMPAPGQYLLAGRYASDSPLPVPLFHTESSAESCLVAPAEPVTWLPGERLQLRGPLGNGFTLPAGARRVALISFERSMLIVRGLISPALKQGAAVVAVTDGTHDDLPDAVEVQPLAALDEILAWADFAAFDVALAGLTQWRERLGALKQTLAGTEAQVFIRMPVPCGGIAECGVCAVNIRSGWRLGCKDGPVFAVRDLL